MKYEQNVYEDASRRMPKAESFVQTPDGPGNVKSVDLLRETVRISLDSAPEPLKTYHGSEIIVLRTARAAGRAIAVPERPARYVEAREEEEALDAPVLTTPFYMDARLEEAPGPGEDRRSRQRRGKIPPPAPGRPAPLRRSQADRGRDSLRARPDGRSRRTAGSARPGRRTGPAQPKPAEGRPAEAAPTAGEGEAKRRRRPHHRGGRRRNKGGGEGGSAPRSE